MLIEERPPTGPAGPFPPPPDHPRRRALWLTLMPVPEVIAPPRAGLFTVVARDPGRMVPGRRAA